MDPHQNYELNGVAYLLGKMPFDAALKPYVKNQTWSCVISGASGLVWGLVFVWLVCLFVCSFVLKEGLLGQTAKILLAIRSYIFFLF